MAASSGLGLAMLAATTAANSNAGSNNGWALTALTFVIMVVLVAIIRRRKPKLKPENVARCLRCDTPLPGNRVDATCPRCGLSPRS